MPTDEERLIIRMEVTQRKMERQLAQLNQQVASSATRAERRFSDMNRTIGRSMSKLGGSVSQSFRGIERAATAAAAALGARTLQRYADAWTQVENQLRAAEQISGRQARSMSALVDLANQSRSPLAATAEIYARLLRVSGDLGASEVQVAAAADITAKAFKAGGAAASEQAAGILQLSQALSSGVLQGDELRSLRENAPLIAKAIADEFGVTIGGLKELGAEGELTAGRVFQAILKAQGDIESAFAATSPTISDGFTVMKNGLLEFVGAMDDGAGSTERLTARLSGIGEALSGNAGAAERFGQRMRAVGELIGEVAANASGTVSAIGQGFGDAARTAARYGLAIIDVIQSFISAAAGAGAAIQASIEYGVYAVSTAAVSMVNSAIGAIEALINEAAAGLNRLRVTVNFAAAAIGAAIGRELPMIPEVASVSLGRVGADTVAPPQLPGAAYQDESRLVRSGLESNESEAIRSLKRILNAPDLARLHNPPPGVGPPDDGGGTVPVSIENVDPSLAGGSGGAGAGGSGGGSGEKGGKGRSGGAGGTKLPGLFDDILKQQEDLRFQIETVQLAEHEVAELTAKQELLNEARRRGLDLDRQYGETGRTLREEIDAQAAAIGRLTEEYAQAESRAQFFDDAQQTLKDGILDAIVEGENLAGVLEDLAKSFARAALEAALFGTGPFAGAGNGNGLLGGFMKAIGGGAASLAGARASGGPVTGGKAYLVGEKGPEIVVPRSAGSVLPNRALRGSGGSPVSVNVINQAGARVDVAHGADGRIDIMVRQHVQSALRRRDTMDLIRRGLSATPAGAR